MRMSPTNRRAAVLANFKSTSAPRRATRSSTSRPTGRRRPGPAAARWRSPARDAARVRPRDPQGRGPDPLGRHRDLHVLERLHGRRRSLGQARRLRGSGAPLTQGRFAASSSSTGSSTASADGGSGVPCSRSTCLPEEPPPSCSRSCEIRCRAPARAADPPPAEDHQQDQENDEDLGQADAHAPDRSGAGGGQVDQAEPVWILVQTSQPAPRRRHVLEDLRFLLRACSCDLMCPCNMSFVTERRRICRVMLVFNVTEGEVDGTDVGGLAVAAMADSPKMMSDGNWRLGLFIDEPASDEQTEKLGAVFGDAGRPDGGGRPLVGEKLGVERARSRSWRTGFATVSDRRRGRLRDRGLVPFGIETESRSGSSACSIPPRRSSTPPRRPARR